jgi:hypothetical protein
MFCFGLNLAAMLSVVSCPLLVELQLTTGHEQITNQKIVGAHGGKTFVSDDCCVTQQPLFGERASP